MRVEGGDQREGRLEGIKKKETKIPILYPEGRKESLEGKTLQARD